MKITRVILAAIAILSLPIAFSQRAVAQSPEVDNISSTTIYDGDSNVYVTISGANLLYSGDECGSVAWWTDASSTSESPGYSSDALFTVTGCDADDIYGYYSVSYPAGSGFIALGTFVVETDNGTGYGPDVNIEDPDE